MGRLLRSAPARLAGGTALVLGLFVALTVSPAAAQPAAASTGAFCATPYGLVPSFTSLAPPGGAGARGDIRANEPDAGFAAEAPASPKAGKRFRATIPVYSTSSLQTVSPATSR